MNYSKNALKIYKKLYINEKLREETPEDVHTRVAKFIANNEEEYEQFIKILNNKIFRPNTPVLINAGCNGKHSHDNQLCACHVSGLEDSMDSIIELWDTAARIFASGSGVGFNITNLREKNSPLSSSGVASGPLEYLHVLEVLAKTVRSGGRARRSAMLATFMYNHPDTFDILNCKQDKKSFSSFNMSMLVDDWFMNNVVNAIYAPIEIKSPNPISDWNKNKRYSKSERLWKNLIKNTWSTGDPGLIFIDSINKTNPLPSKGKITTGNPCGEVVLFDNSVCCIGSINLNKCITYNKKPIFDFNIFNKYIHSSILFLDNVIDKTTYVHPKYEKTMKETRPIGLGIMGFADVLIKLGIPYNSNEAKEFFKDICKNLNLLAIQYSIKMCQDGKEPINIPEEDQENFIDLLEYYGCSDYIIDAYKSYGIRNCTWTSIAPTGSISISADCSYSFEPLSAIVWQKELAETHEIMNFVYPEFEKWLNNYFNTIYSSNEISIIELENRKKTIINDIINNNGSIKGLKYIPEKIQELFVTAHDISPYDKIDMQSAGQRYISLGISSTCNIPNSATEEDIERIFIYAWEKGLKGITIYRDGSHEWQPINFGKKECKEVTGPSTPNYNVPLWEQKTKLIERPITRDGKTFEIKTTNGKLFLTLNKDNDGNPLEVFLRLGKAGHLENLLLDTIARLISKNLQAGVPYNDVSSILRDIRGDKFWFKLLEEGESIGAESIMDAVGIIMDIFFPKEIIQAPEVKIVTNIIYREQCPNCNKYTLRRDTGCKGGLCEECGFSNCG